jgi:hypothetical protein
MAPNAEIHVTMGSLGVLSMAAGSDEMAHVILGSRAGVTLEVQQIVRERPARLNGAGDALPAASWCGAPSTGSVVSGSGRFFRTSTVRWLHAVLCCVGRRPLRACGGCVRSALAARRGGRVIGFRVRYGCSSRRSETEPTCDGCWAAFGVARHQGSPGTSGRPAGPNRP